MENRTFRLQKITERIKRACGAGRRFVDGVLALRNNSRSAHMLDPMLLLFKIRYRKLFRYGRWLRWIPSLR